MGKRKNSKKASSSSNSAVSITDKRAESEVTHKAPLPEDVQTQDELNRTSSVEPEETLIVEQNGHEAIKAQELVKIEEVTVDDRPIEHKEAKLDVESLKIKSSKVEAIRVSDLVEKAMNLSESRYAITESLHTDNDFKAEEQARIADDAQLADQLRLADETKFADQAILAEAACLSNESKSNEEARVRDLVEQAIIQSETKEQEWADQAEKARIANEANEAQEILLAENARLEEEAKAKEIQQAEIARLEEEAKAKEIQLADNARFEEETKAKETRVVENARLEVEAQVKEIQAAEQAKVNEEVKVKETQLAEQARRAEVSKKSLVESTNLKAEPWITAKPTQTNTVQTLFEFATENFTASSQPISARLQFSPVSSPNLNSLQIPLLQSLLIPDSPPDNYNRKAIAVSNLILLIGGGKDTFINLANLTSLPFKTPGLVDEILIQLVIQIRSSTTLDWAKSIDNYWLALQVFTNTFPGGGKRVGLTKIAEKIIREEIEFQSGAASRFGSSIALNLSRSKSHRYVIEPYFNIRSGRPIAGAYEKN
jgi:hypothetical protein